MRWRDGRLASVRDLGILQGRVATNLEVPHQTAAGGGRHVRRSVVKGSV